MDRIFIVGCPRSGTTLLQSLIAAHPEVVSFPESHFFSKIIGGKKIYRNVGLTSPFTSQMINNFLQKCNRSDLKLYPFKPLWTERAAVREFVALLDRMTSDQEGEVWIEKTPRHLHFIEDIQRLVPGAKFIHMKRSGKDVIASLYKVTKQYSREWEGAMSLQECTDRWLNDIQRSNEYLDQDNHIEVAYQQLVRQRKKVLDRIFKFVGISKQNYRQKDYKEEAGELTEDGEVWKEKTRKEIQNSNNKKFYRVLNAEQRDYVFDRIT